MQEQILVKNLVQCKFIKIKFILDHFNNFQLNYFTHFWLLIFSYANQVLVGHEVLVAQNNELTPLEVT